MLAIYSYQHASTEAAAAALFGEIGTPGRLPVGLSRLAFGHGLEVGDREQAAAAPRTSRDERERREPPRGAQRALSSALRARASHGLQPRVRARACTPMRPNCPSSLRRYTTHTSCVVSCWNT